MSKIILIAHNVRSTHNVGSLLRTAEGLGVSKVYLTGYTPYPPTTVDSRLPHLSNKLGRQIHKTALGAEQTLAWEHIDDILTTIDKLRQDRYLIAALEQTSGSMLLPAFKPPEKIALIVGREVEGIESEVLARADITLEIPMSGRKESFNVVQAAAMALYQLRCLPG